MHIEDIFIMGEFDYSWIDKFTNVGWYPNDIDEQVKRQLGSAITEPILGIIRTGDHIGEIIGVCFSSIENKKRIETTLLGFTIGGDNAITYNNVIMPRNRIPGIIIISKRNIFICGREIYTIPFKKIFAAHGSRNTTTSSNYDLQKLGEIEYSYANDIYISKLKINRQKILDTGYDEFSIAIVIGYKRPNLIENIWKQIERQAAL
jgi:hypothetical protein